MAPQNQRGPSPSQVPIPDIGRSSFLSRPRDVWALDRLGSGRALPVLLWSEPWTAAPVSTGMLREATSHKVPSAALCSAAAGCTRQILGVGSRSQSLLVPNEKVTWDARSVLAAGGGTLRSSAQHPSFWPAAPAGKRPTAALRLVRPSQRPAPEPGCLPAGTLGQAPAKHSPRAGLRASRTLGLVPRSSSPPASRPGSFLLAKQRIANQSNHGKERLQQTLVTALFPSDCLRPSGPGPARR